MPTSSLNRAYLLSGVLLALWAASAQAQPPQAPRANPPEPIVVHPHIAPAEPVGVGGDKAGAVGPVAPAAGDVATIAPIGGAAQTAGAAQAADPAALRSSLVLSQLLDGGKSVDALFRSGDLTPEVARYILSERVEGWGTIDHRWVEGVRRDLAGLVWREGGEALHKQAVAPQVLPRYFRLWLADYLSNAGDEQVLAVGEQILKDTPKPLGGDDGQGDKPLAFQTIERMARYLAARGQQVESAGVWARIADFFDAKGWWVPDSYVEMARMYASAGQSDKAKEFYAKAWASGSQRYMALVVGDQARDLMGRGQHAQAQKMLRDALPSLQGHSEQVFAQTFLARSLLLSGDLEGARAMAQAVLDAYAKMPPGQKPDEGVIGGLARATRDEAAGWIENPIQVEPRQLKAATVKDGAQPIVRRLRVRTLKPVTLAVSSSTPQIKARVLSDDGWSAAASTEQVLVVEIAPGAPANATLSITSQQYPNVEAKVPVLLGTGS